jgi:hypothetical protein
MKIQVPERETLMQHYLECNSFISLKKIITLSLRVFSIQRSHLDVVDSLASLNFEDNGILCKNVSMLFSWKRVTKYSVVSALQLPLMHLVTGIDIPGRCVWKPIRNCIEV